MEVMNCPSFLLLEIPSIYWRALESGFYHDHTLPVYIYLHIIILMYSGTSDKGPSEKRTASL